MIYSPGTLIINIYMFINYFVFEKSNFNRFSIVVIHKFWKFLGTLGVGNKPHPEFKNTIDLNEINRYFSSTITLDL